MSFEIKQDELETLQKRYLCIIHVRMYMYMYMYVPLYAAALKRSTHFWPNTTSEMTPTTLISSR